MPKHRRHITAQQFDQHIHTNLRKIDLIQIRNHIRLLKTIWWLENLPSTIKAGAIHTFIMVLHFSIWQHPSQTGMPIVRISIWAISLTIVLASVHLAENISRLVRRPRVHWIGTTRTLSQRERAG